METDGDHIYINRKFVPKTLLMGIFLLALGGAPFLLPDASTLWETSRDEGMAWTWPFVLFLGACAIVLSVKYYFFPQPLFVLSAEGIEWGRKVRGFKLAWTEIKALQAFTVTHENTPVMRGLGVVLANPEAVFERFKTVDKIMALASEATGSRVVYLPLDNLSVSDEELLARIRKYFQGPIELKST